MPRHVTDSWRDYLGPGAVTTFLLAALVAIVGLGLPVWWRLRQVLAEAARARVVRPEPADLLVVLGRVLVDDHPSEVFVGRLAHAAAMWRDGIAPKIVVTGGLTGRASRTEADAGREWLVAAGVPAAVIEREGASRHTLENLYNVREHFGRCAIVLVSDPLHLARARALAENLGLSVTCCGAAAADPPTRGGRLVRALREAALLHWYSTGVVWSRLIGSERLLSRVT
jgi:uncharacterized SAM-binding protein YcdF (DUF218 family)